jgi:hypothetical protein
MGVTNLCYGCYKPLLWVLQTFVMWGNKSFLWVLQTFLMGVTEEKALDPQNHFSWSPSPPSRPVLWP